MQQGRANVNTVGPYGRTALMMAAENGRIRIVEELSKNGINVNLDAIDSTGNTDLLLAMIKGHKNIAKLLIEKGACVNAINGGICCREKLYRNSGRAPKT